MKNRNSQLTGWHILIGFGFIALIGFVLFLIYLELIERSADKVIPALEQAGFKYIEITGWDSFGCERELAKYRFQARFNDREIEGTICCGLLKKCTIRW